MPTTSHCLMQDANCGKANGKICHQKHTRDLERYFELSDTILNVERVVDEICGLSAHTYHRNNPQALLFKSI